MIRFLNYLAKNGLLEFLWLNMCLYTFWKILFLLSELFFRKKLYVNNKLKKILLLFFPSCLFMVVPSFHPLVSATFRTENYPVVKEKSVIWWLQCIIYSTLFWDKWCRKYSNGADNFYPYEFCGFLSRKDLYHAHLLYFIIDFGSRWKSI